jgi:hypothetical protein
MSERKGIILAGGAGRAAQYIVVALADGAEANVEPFSSMDF